MRSVPHSYASQGTDCFGNPPFSKAPLLRSFSRDQVVDTVTQAVRQISMCYLIYRLISRTHSATWLSRVVLWFIDTHLDDGVNPDPEEEQMRTIGQLRGLYATAHDGVRSPNQVFMANPLCD
jgi:hypothetical protein